VAEAADGRPGEAAVAERLPDLLITDIIMPDQEGIGLIMSLRQKHKALKILAISGGGRLSHTDYLQMAERLGANATLAKPFRRDALLAAVQKLLTD
jgi:YesN/AraC family two-component response regulator